MVRDRLAFDAADEDAKTLAEWAAAMEKAR
jgi:hypothetical protein